MRLFGSIRLDKNLDARLGHLAQLTGRTKSYYVNQALEEQIQVLETRSFADRAARHASQCRNVSSRFTSWSVPSGLTTEARTRRSRARRVLARRELSFGRSDLPARQSAAHRAAQARTRQAAPARALGHLARPQFHLRAPQPRHPQVRSRHDLHRRPPGTAARRWSRTRISRGPTASTTRRSRKTSTASCVCSASSRFRAGSRATSRPRLPARSTKRASSAMRCRTPTARSSTTRS